MIPPFFRIETKGVTESTNDDVMKRAIAGESEGLVIQALRQTSGRGRNGRVWESPESNLYLSILIRPRALPKQVLFYSFAAAMAVYDAVLSVMPNADVQLKWPNDVLLNGKKISGILLESAPVENGIVDWVVIGIGINVSSCPDNVLYPTTSLNEAGAKTNVDQVLEEVLKSFDQWHLTLRFDGFRPVRRAWLAYARIGAISVKLQSEEIKGEFAGIDENGNLMLRTEDETEKIISAGDVFFSDKDMC